MPNPATSASAADTVNVNAEQAPVMSHVASGDKAAKLNTVELLKDYIRKVNESCRLHVLHDQDEAGATLVLHVESGKVAEGESLAKLAERLTAATGGVPSPVIEPLSSTSATATGEAVSESAAADKKKAKASEQQPAQPAPTKHHP